MFDPQFETPKSGRLSINTPIFANILRPTNGEVIHNRGIPLAAAHNNKSVSKSNSGRRNSAGESSVSFTGEFPSNFYLKNMISTYTKDFFVGKKWPKYATFQRKEIPNRHIFYNKFQ